MFMAMMAPGIFAGPPISGAILSVTSNSRPDAPGGDNGDKDYLGVQFFCGAVLLLGAGFALAGRLTCERKLRVKV